MTPNADRLDTLRSWFVKCVRWSSSYLYHAQWFTVLMGYFSKYRSHYKEPERYTSDVARERKLAAVLERERQFMDLVRPAAALFPVKKAIARPKWKVYEDLEARGPKAASIAAALNSFKESDFADPAKRQLYRRLRSAQNQQRAKPAGADKRQFNATGKQFASTVSGNVARYGVFNKLASSMVARFIRPHAVVPCIQRVMRREVMFASGKAGRGYRTPHRRTWASGIPC